MKNFFIFLGLLLISISTQASAAPTELEGTFKLGPALIMIFVLILFILVGLKFRAKDTSDYYAAGRKISRVGSGMAIASNWMSAASFLGMAALMFGLGYHGLAFVAGWTGGYVLLLILMAGQIRKYGKYTAPDFIGDRYYSTGLRLASAIIVIFISIAYTVPQFAGIGLMFKWIMGIDYFYALLIGGGVVLIYTLISGMLGVTKNMQVQYVIIAISFLIPLFVLLYDYNYFFLLPPVGYGSVVSDIVTGIPLAESNYLMNVHGHQFAIVASPEYVMPWSTSTGVSFFQWMAIIFSLMIGTAGLPHVIQRFYVVPKSNDARWSVVWGLFFICIIYWTAPVYAAFGKILAAHPEVGRLAPDAIVIYTAQLGNVHPLIVGFLAAGAVSAAFSTTAGLLISGASAFSHDIYVRVMNPNAEGKKQLLIARMGTVLMAVIVAMLAMLELALIGELVALTFSIAGSTIFPLFLLGIWWSGSNKQGAIAGLVVGVAISVFAISYFVAGRLGTVLPHHEFVSYYLGAWYFGWVGAPLAILTNILVSKFTKPTPIEIRKFLAEQVH